MIADRNNICICCNLFIIFVASSLLIKVYPDFVLTIKATMIINNYFDYCRYTNNGSHFCKKISTIILANQYTILGVVNGINTIIYSFVPHYKDIYFFAYI